MKLSEADVVAEIEEMTLRRLRLWVRRGWVAPSLGTSGHSFDEVDVARLRLVCELKSELKLNDDAVPVVLSLIDQLHGIRRELKTLARALDEQPVKVRQRVRDSYRRLLEG